MKHRIIRMILLLAWMSAWGSQAQNVDPLTQGVEAALSGDDPGAAWRTYCGARVQREGERGSPSANWPTLACSTAYILGEPWAAGWWRRYLGEAERQNRLWGKEPGSTIYRSWMVLPVMVVRDQAFQRGDRETQALADRWLRASWALLTLGACHAPERPSVFAGRSWAQVSTTLIGARSYSRARGPGGARRGMPQHWDYNLLTITLSRALGWTTAASGWNSWVERIERHLEAPAPARYGLTRAEQETLQRHLVRGDRLAEIVPWLFGTVVSLEIRRYELGAATIMWRAGGSAATAPIYAGVCDHEGNRRFAAPDPGNRHDISFGRAFLDGEWIVAQRGDGTVSPWGWPVAHPGRVKLPDGRLLYAVEVGPAGAEVLRGDVPSSQPTVAVEPAVQGSDEIDWPELLAVARALVRQSEAQNRIKAKRRVHDAWRLLGMDEDPR